MLLKFEAEYRYANAVRLFYKTNENVYVCFEGSQDWIFAEYLKPLQAKPAAVPDAKIGDDEIHFPFKSDKQDFIDAIKTRGQTLEDAEVGHRGAKRRARGSPRDDMRRAAVSGLGTRVGAAPAVSRAARPRQRTNRALEPCEGCMLWDGWELIRKYRLTTALLQ